MFSSQDPIANSRSAASHKASSQAPTPLSAQSVQMGRNMANTGAMQGVLGGLVQGLASKPSSTKPEPSKSQSCNGSAGQGQTSSSSASSQSHASNNQSLDDLLDVNANASGGGWCGTGMNNDEDTPSTPDSSLNESLTQLLTVLQQMLGNGQYGSNAGSEQQALVSQLIHDIEQLLTQSQTQQPSVESLTNQLQAALDQGDMTAFSNILNQLQQTLNQQQSQLGNGTNTSGTTGSDPLNNGFDEAEIARQQMLRDQQVSQTLDQMRQDTQAALAMLQAMVFDDPTSTSSNNQGDMQSVLGFGNNNGTGLSNNGANTGTGQNVFNPSLLPNARPFNP